MSDTGRGVQGRSLPIAIKAVSPAAMKKGQLADFLRQRDVKDIVVDGNRIIQSDKFSANAGKNNGGPTLVQLSAAVKTHCETHSINTTVPQQLMHDAGHALMYTPPYVSELQPIELIWAFTKSLVARRSHRTRTAAAATIQTREAMDEVDASLCQRVIEHTHTEHGGTLQQFANLAAVASIDAAEGINPAESIDE